MTQNLVDATGDIYLTWHDVSSLPVAAFGPLTKCVD